MFLPLKGSLSNFKFGQSQVVKCATKWNVYHFQLSRGFIIFSTKILRPFSAFKLHSSMKSVLIHVILYTRRLRRMEQMTFTQEVSDSIVASPPIAPASVFVKDIFERSWIRQLLVMTRCEDLPLKHNIARIPKASAGVEDVTIIPFQWRRIWPHLTSG